MNMKKWLSLLLAALMVMSMASAFAEISENVIPEEEFNYIMPLNADGSITVSNPAANHVYKAYKLFDVAYSDSNFAYTITSDNPWFDLLEGYNSKNTFVFTQVGSSSTYVVTLKAGVTLDAAALAKYLSENIPEDAVANEFTASGSTLTANQLNYGYYFVTSTLGSLCMLDTASPEVTIQEKNQEPTIDKQVKEDSDQEWGNENTAQIGDTVEFKTTIHAKPGAEGYVLHDKMSEGLTLKQDSIVVKVGDTTLTQGTDYTVSFETTDDCDFEITFTETYLDSITENTDIIVTYSAILNDKAVISTDANTNDTKLVYGDEMKSETEWAHTDTYTFQFDLVKTDDKNNLLTGAKFELYDAKTGGNKIPLVKEEDGTYRFATTEEQAAPGFTSAVIEAGHVTIKGLDANTTYWLEETAAPAGYNMLTERVEVAMKETNLTATVTENTWFEGGVHVVNKTGAELPSTGGTGTTMLYAVGGVLVLAAFVLIITKRRASEN